MRTSDFTNLGLKPRTLPHVWDFMECVCLFKYAYAIADAQCRWFKEVFRACVNVHAARVYSLGLRGLQCVLFVCMCHVLLKALRV